MIKHTKVHLAFYDIDNWFDHYIFYWAKQLCKYVGFALLITPFFKEGIALLIVHYLSFVSLATMHYMSDYKIATNKTMELLEGLLKKKEGE